jgi:hypothetical protein
MLQLEQPFGKYSANAKLSGDTTSNSASVHCFANGFSVLGFKTGVMKSRVHAPTYLGFDVHWFLHSGTASSPKRANA